MQTSLVQISPKEIIALVRERQHQAAMLKAIVDVVDVGTDKGDDKELMNLILAKLNSEGV